MKDFKPALFFLSFIILTLTGGVLGAPPLIILRQQLGGFAYWLMGLGVCALFWGLKAPGLMTLFFANILLIGIFFEVCKMKQSLSIKCLIALVTTYLSLTILFAGLSRFGIYDFLGVLMTQIHESLSLFPTLITSLEEIFNQLPSLGLIYLTVSLAITLMLEKPLLRWAEEPQVSRPSLTLFRLPDSFIWLFLGSMLFSFGKFENPELQMLAANVLNISLLAYFFQGLAVVSRYFQVYKVGRFWRVFWYVLLVLAALYIHKYFRCCGLLGGLQKSLYKKEKDFKQK